MNELPTLARLLLAVRKQRRWTQRQLAHKLMVSERTVREWEHGRAEPALLYVDVVRGWLSESDVSQSKCSCRGSSN